MIHAINNNKAVIYTLVMNTDTHALTEYVNFPFNSAVIVDGICFVAASDGIYIIDEGDTDSGSNIDVEIQAGSFDTMTAISKMAIITGVVVNSPLTTGGIDVTVSIDNGDIYSYPALPEGDGSHIEMRAKFGRGLKPTGRYAQCGIKNKQGSAFTVDSMRIYSYPPRKGR